jgi:hypothetical protein
MEVHHHPELPHGEKKRFKEYLLEFLMIFLAVTMGFIAENIREHLSDSSKESEYITGMVKNLGDDTANLKNVIRDTRLQINGIDSLRNVSKDKLDDVKVQDSLYLLTSKYLFYANDFKNNDITLSQLRNAGGYRLIRSEGVLDSIAVYESKIHDLNDEFNDMFTSLEKARDNANFIFDLNIAHKFRLNPTSTPILITNDKAKIYNYYNGCWLVLLGLDGYNHMLEDHLKYTARIIVYLKKQYGVD